MKKRIISFMLVLTMMVGMVPMFGITTNAAKQTHYCGAVGTICGEIPYAYRAMKTTYPEDFFITWINMFESYDGSTRDYPYDAEKFNEKIKDSLSSELASHLDPDKINAALFVNCAAGTGSFADAGTAEYDLYDALFLSMLLENASNSEVQDSVFEFINEIISALNTVQEYVINGTTVTSKFIDLIPEIKGTGPSTKISTLLKQVKGFNKISASFDEFFGTCEELDLNSGFDVFVKLIEVLVEVADETTEVVASIEDCILIYRNVGPTYAAVLERIYNNTEDFTIKQIATKYYTLIKSDSWFEVIALSAIEVVNGAVEAGAGVGEIVLKTLIGTTKYGPQYAAVVAALAALDAIIGTKAEIEAAYALICMQKMDEAMANTLTELDSEFKANFNDGKDDLASYCANEYVTAAIMCLRMLQKEYDYCQKFFDAVYDNGLVNKLMNCFPTANKAKFDGWTSHVKTQKEFLKNISEGIFEEGSSLRKQYHSHISLIEKGMKVTYDLNGGSSIEDFAPQTKAYNLHMITRSGTPMREGYVFTGWRPTINGNYINPVDFWYYKDENAISPEINPCYFADEIVLTAQWTEIQNTITYNANGGTGAPASHENTVGNTTLSTTVPTRTGHTFLGWDENPNAKEPTYRKKNDGSAITIDKEGNVTLYAVWEAGVFDIVFHANGGKFSDNSDSKTMQKTYLKNFTVSPEVPTRDGYTFSGYWTLNADGSGTEYKQGNTYSDIGGAGLSAKHLYARWIKSKTSATFRYDYTNCTYNDITVPLTNGSATVTLVDPPASKVAEIGKEFVQWKYYYPDGSGYKYYQTGDTITITDDFTVYAEWADPASGALLSVLTDKTSYLPGDTVTLTITADNTGYFTVDASDNNGFKIKCADGSTASSGVFVEKSSASTSNTLKCYDNGSAYTVKVYIPNNCSDGTYTVDIVASNGTYGVSGTETSCAEEVINIVVNTKEEEVSNYALIYDLNGGSGDTPETVYFNEYDYIVLAHPDTDNFKRDGYKFLGWAEKSNATSAKYKGDKEYQLGSSKTLYAVWKAKNTYLEFDIYNQDSTDSSKVYKPGDTIYIAVDIDNSDHFYINTADCPGMKFEGPDSMLVTEDVFYEKNAPRYDGQEVTYTNGTRIYIKAYIPNNCPDGTYQILGKAADDDINPGTGESIGTILSDSFSVHVKANNSADAIYLNKSEITVHEGDDKYVEAFLLPDYFNDDKKITRNIEWYSSNENVATVDDSGKKVEVYGNRSGTATITATIDGVSASCKVTVVRCSHTVKNPHNDYLKSPATCASQATYYYVCECGDVGASTYKHGDLDAHNYSAWSVIQQPAETTAGVEQRTCSGCQNTEERSIPATGAHTTHTPGKAWHSDSDKHWHVCSVDGCTVKLNEGTHTFGELSVETPATETNTGVGYRTCTCGYSKSETIPVLIHTHIWDTVTYTWAAAGSSCTAQRVCTKDSNHKETATATITRAVKIPATETIKGTTTYTATFTESWAAKQTKDVQDIPVTTHVHTWGTVTYTWAADGSSCTAQRVCTKDSNHKETATATITSAVKIPATETVKGTTTYTATFTENWAARQTKDIQNIPVTSHTHTWGTVTYTWAADGSSCTAQRVCTKDSNHKETATATITGAVKIPATETIEGTTTYTATFTESWAATQTKDIQDIPVTTHIHTWGAVTYTWAADGSSCTAQRVCTADATHKETVAATITSVVKIPATETIEGTTTYNATFTESWAAQQTKDIQDIPVVQIQHNISITWANDSTYHWHNCSCGKAHDKQMHTESEWIVDEAATASKNGLHHKECLVCKYVTIAEVIPATGSSFDEDFWYWYLMMIYSQEFNITATATEGGVISSAGNSKVKYDKSITYTITPDEGYIIADVLVDGKSVEAVSEYTFKRVKAAHTISAIFEKIEWKNPFNDVSKESWYYEDIEFVYENHLMIGTGENTFSPDIPVNRAMLVTVLWRLEGSPIVDSHVDFVDIPASEWYTDAINWASANGIVNGYGDGIFGAMNDLTHEQIMAILNRYAVYKKLSENVSGNADNTYTNSEWAENNVLWADINGMFDGIGSDITNLTKGATRAELAAYLKRFCENVMK